MKSRKADRTGESEGCEEEKLLQCVMCNCMTIEEYLKRHIRYNHLISKEEIIDKLYNLHYPANFVSVGTQTETSGEEYVARKENQNEDQEREEEEETCGACETSESVISPKARCISCKLIYHWACVDLTSKPPKHWTCSKCSKEMKKKSSAGDHSYSSRFINETITEDHHVKSTKEENGTQSNGSQKLAEESEPEVSDSFAENEDENMENDHSYGKSERGSNGRQRQKSVKLNKLEDLCDMSKGELKDLCYSEDVNSKGTREVLEERLRKHFKKNFTTRDRKKLSKLTEITEGPTVCTICGLGYDLPDSLELGPLYKYGSCVAHLHCLMFSSGLIQRGEEDQGIIGFLPADIQSELSRGSALRCAFCSEVFATVGCCQKSCSKSYHLPCGIKYGAICEYYGNFDSYCPAHRARRVAKNRPRNYVLTDLGLVPEHVDIDNGFQPEKYKLKLQKFQRGKMSRKHEKESKQMRQGNKRAGELKNRRTGSLPAESSDEEEERRRNKKIKKIHIKEEKNDGFEGGGRRSGRRVVKKIPGADIYRSAVDELKNILEKKELIKVDDTFSELAGTSRKKRKVTVKREKYDSDEDVNWVKPRASKRHSRSDDEDDEEPERKLPQVKNKKKSVKKSFKQSEQVADEDESLESIKIFLKDSKKTTKGRRGELSESSEDELPFPKIRKKSRNSRHETSKEINRDMEKMMREEDNSNSDVNINQLIDDLEDDVEEPFNSRPTMSGRDSDYNPEDAGSFSESSDFEITEKESSADNAEISPRNQIKEKKKSKKEVSFAEDVTEIDEGRNSKFFNVDNLLMKSKARQRDKKAEEEEVLPSCYVTVHLEEPKEEAEETEDPDSGDSPVPTDAIEEKCSDDANTKSNMIENSSDEEDQPPPPNLSTDADFDSLFSRDETEKVGEDVKRTENTEDTSSPSPRDETENIEEEVKTADNTDETESEFIDKDTTEDSSISPRNEPENISEGGKDSDILNKAVEEAGIVPQAANDSGTRGEGIEQMNETDPFSTSPFKLLFSTIGGFGSEDQEQRPSESENLSSSLDPDEFLQRHFK